MEKRATASDTATRQRPRRRRLWVAAGTLVAAALVAATVAAVSPWPSVLVIRSVFEKGAAATVAEMEPHVPDTKLTEYRGIAYAPPTGSLPQSDTTLDVFTPANGTKKLTTIVWVHGGAWISGQKENIEPYMRILAAQGYTTIALNYTTAPEAAYPTALTQLNTALAYIGEHASDWNA